MARSKWSQMIWNSGREIVRPEYTAKPNVVGKAMLDKTGQKQSEQHHMEPEIKVLNAQTMETLHQQGPGEGSSSQNQSKSTKACDGADAKTTPLGTKPLPRWCPTGLIKTQMRRVQKLWAREIAEKRREEERDRWFNQERRLVATKKTWKEKCIEREEKDDSSGSEDRLEDYKATRNVDINMVFQLLSVFCLPKREVARLELGAERAMFKKPEKLGQHMKLLYIQGYLDDQPVNRMLVDGGAFVNIMPWTLFEKLGHTEKKLMKTNMTLSGFSGEASNARGIISKEPTVGSKTVLAVFFVVNTRGKYNVLLGRDWIHANGCMPSTLHPCVI
jgi:hypothetical protein